MTRQAVAVLLIDVPPKGASLCLEDGLVSLSGIKQFLRALSDQLAGIDVDPAISGALTPLVTGFTQLI